MDYYFDLDDKNKKRDKLIKEIVFWFLEILVVVLLAFMIVRFGIGKTTMIGDSMAPTISNNDSVFVDKVTYAISKPKRFDVIAFSQAGEEHGYFSVKRIVGLPGEKVQIKEGKIIINGQPIQEKYEFEPIKSAGLASEEITLSDNEYFVIGDNRNNSEDSRFSNVGNVIRKDIKGKIWMGSKPLRFITGPHAQKTEG